MKDLSNYITESLSAEVVKLQSPELTELGEGIYDGAWWGNSFLYNGKKYHVDCGVRSRYPVKATAVIRDGKVTYPHEFPRNADLHQYKSLVHDFDNAE